MTARITRTHVVHGLINEYRRAALRARETPAQSQRASFGTAQGEPVYASQRHMRRSFRSRAKALTGQILAAAVNTASAERGHYHDGNR
jgi:hypothetical protein